MTWPEITENVIPTRAFDYLILSTTLSENGQEPRRRRDAGRIPRVLQEGPVHLVVDERLRQFDMTFAGRRSPSAFVDVSGCRRQRFGLRLPIHPHYPRPIKNALSLLNWCCWRVVRDIILVRPRCGTNAVGEKGRILEMFFFEQILFVKFTWFWVRVWGLVFILE